MPVAEDETLVKKTVNQNRLMSRQGIMERAFAFWFDSFVYNQIWEDPRVDLEALQLNSTSNVLTIASGGCNVLNYLVANPASITALDINQYHIYLTRLKIAALKTLPSHESFFRFFGSADSVENIENYDRYIKVNLDTPTREFWEGGSWMRRKVLGSRINYFKTNFYDYAKLGYLLRFVHVLCKVTRKDPSRLLRAETREEQEQIFNETIAPFFDNKLIKAVGKQPLIMFSLGIPPKQYEALRQEMNGDIVDLYRERVKKLMCDFPIKDNYFTWQALSRKYDHANRSAIPDYLRAESYETLKKNAGRVNMQIAHLTEHLKKQQPGALDRLVLLDSQDWMTQEQINELWREIARVGAPGTRIIFRTGSSRSPIEAAVSPELRNTFVYEQELSLELFKRDRSAIYGGFHLYVKRS